MQANYLLNSRSSSVWSNNNQSRLASSAYLIERGVRSIMKTSVVNILCPTNLLKYALHGNLERLPSFSRKSVFLELFCTLTSRATPHTLHSAASRNLPRSARCRQLYMILIMFPCNAAHWRGTPWNLPHRR